MDAIADLFPAYSQLETRLDADQQAIWIYMKAKPRQSFTVQLLSELRDAQSRLASYLSGSNPSAEGPIRYLVLASGDADAFNLGGDLELFQKLIATGDRGGLEQYARLCVDAVYDNFTNLGVPGLSTISLVQGMALGGGFEAALSSHTVIAERGSRMGVPDILFNLFPGMGAYNLLARRVGPARARRFLEEGQQYTAEELHSMGVVDHLADDGGGARAVHNYIQRHRRARNGLQAIQQVYQRVDPLTHAELMDVVAIWVDTALRITERDLRMMARLAAAQHRLAANGQRGNAEVPG